MVSRDIHEVLVKLIQPGEKTNKQTITKKKNPNAMRELLVIKKKKKIIHHYQMTGENNIKNAARNYY